MQDEVKTDIDEKRSRRSPLQEIDELKAIVGQQQQQLATLTELIRGMAKISGIPQDLLKKHGIKPMQTGDIRKVI